MAEQRPYSSNDLIAAQRRCTTPARNAHPRRVEAEHVGDEQEQQQQHRHCPPQGGFAPWGPVLPSESVHPSTPPKSRIRLKTRVITATTSCDISPKNLP